MAHARPIVCALPPSRLAPKRVEDLVLATGWQRCGSSRAAVRADSGLGLRRRSRGRGSRSRRVTGANWGDDARKSRPSGGTTVLAVERFEDADFLRDRPFVVPPDIWLRERFRSMFYAFFQPEIDERLHVVVEFDKQAAPDVMSRVWDPQQVVTRLPGGRARIEFDVPSL